MTQDTRKDRRVKIVSLNVRYKSATVDEFIENHAHDVSRGGIYIKTGNPFPPGTLLKFEIRLASDQAVIAGVGRVVWKRDSAQGNGERPAGMGVKFIKIDDPSKSVIDKLVNTRADAGKSFEAEPEGMGASVPPMAPPRAAPASVSAGKSTMLGVGATTAGETRTSTTPGMGGPLARKATMMGLGVPGASRPPAVPGAGPRPGGDLPATSTPPTPATTSVSPVPPRPGKPTPPGGMFPPTDVAKDAPPKQEQTVMKQAAELLEEALREAGGSMEEIGTNPLFAGTSTRSTTPKPMPSVKPEKPVLEKPAVDEDEEATRVRPASEMASAPPPKVSSDPPLTTRDSPTAKVVVEQDATQPSARRRVLTSSQGAAVPAVPAPAPKKSRFGALLLTFGFVTAFAAGVWLYRDRLPGLAAVEQQSPPAPVQAATATAPPASAITPPPAPSPTSSASAAASASASAAPAAASASATASAAASASGAKAIAAGGAKPPGAPAPRASKPASSPAGEEGASAGGPGASGGSNEAPSHATASPPAAAASPEAPAAAAAASPPPAAKPKPKPVAKPADDNPY